MGPDAMIFVYWMLSFKPTFSLSSFAFIKRLFSPSSLSAIRVVSSVYLRLIFLLAILIPDCASSSLAFHMMYSAYKLNKPSDNLIQTFPQIWSDGNISKLMLWVQHYPDTTVRQRHYRKRKLEINIPDEYGSKNPNKIQPWCTPFPIWNQSVVPCPVLTVASWPAYWFL